MESNGCLRTAALGWAFRALLYLRPPRPTAGRGLTIVVLLLAVAAAHHFTGRHITLYSFFVLPCGLAAWSIGLAAGVLVAGLSALSQLASDLVLKRDTEPVVLVVNAGLRLALYALVAWGTDVVGGLLDQLSDLSRYDALTGLRGRGTS